MVELIGIYLIIGVLFALHASQYGQNFAEVPSYAYLITILVWPYTLYLVIVVYRGRK